MKRGLFFVGFAALATLTAQAQRYLGVSTGNYNTINSMYLNPANLGGCNEKIAINLFGFNLAADNNLGTISSISDIVSSAGSGDSNASRNIFKYANNDKFSLMLPAVDVRLPAVLYRINDNHTVAIGLRARAFNEFNSFDKSLYTLLTDKASLGAGNNTLKAQNFNWTAHAWSELGFSYGGVVTSNDMFEIKVGASLKYLIGVGYMGIKGKNLDLAYRTGSDTFYATNSDIEFASNAQGLEDGIASGFSASKILGGESGGKGMGFDLGASISLLPEGGDKSVGPLDNGKSGEEGFALKLSASILDIGSINYKSSYTVKLGGNGYLTGKGIFENVKNYEDLKTYAKTQGFSADTGKAATKVYLPTTLVIGGDYHAWKKFYANATLFLNMASDEHFGSKHYSQFTVTPRFDSKILTVGMPLTYNMLTHSMRMGMGFRVTGFYFGSDDMLALFSGNQYGFNFYIGGMVPICRGKTSKK